MPKSNQIECKWLQLNFFGNKWFIEWNCCEGVGTHRSGHCTPSSGSERAVVQRNERFHAALHARTLMGPGPTITSSDAYAKQQTSRRSQQGDQFNSRGAWRTWPIPQSGFPYTDIPSVSQLESMLLSLADIINFQTKKISIL